MTDGEHRPANIEEGTLHAGGMDIHYVRTGGGKPQLVALHGLIGSGACLMPLARALEADFDVILPDARGHGRSSSPDRGYTYAGLAADLLSLTEGLELDDPTLIGHSMGGMTAAVAALDLGSRLRALVLIDPTFISPEWQREVHESDIVAEHRRLLSTTREELVAQARLRQPRRPLELLEHLADARLRTKAAAFEILAPPNPDYRELVREVAVPTLLLLAESGVVSADTGRELQALNPLLRCQMIPNAGHGVPYDEPGQVGAAIVAFLDSLEAGRLR